MKESLQKFFGNQTPELRSTIRGRVGEALKKTKETANMVVFTAVATGFAIKLARDYGLHSSRGVPSDEEAANWTSDPFNETQAEVGNTVHRVEAEVLLDHAHIVVPEDVKDE